MRSSLGMAEPISASAWRGAGLQVSGASPSLAAKRQGLCSKIGRHLAHDWPFRKPGAAKLSLASKHEIDRCSIQSIHGPVYSEYSTFDIDHGQRLACPGLTCRSQECSSQPCGRICDECLGLTCAPRPFRCVREISYSYMSQLLSFYRDSVSLLLLFLSLTVVFPFILSSIRSIAAALTDSQQPLRWRLPSPHRSS